MNSKLLLIKKNNRKKLLSNSIKLDKGQPKLLHITYSHSSHKRYVSNADIFFQIFTCYILGILFEGEIIYNNSWKYSNIITSNSYKNNSIKELKKYDAIIKISNFNKFSSISYQELNKLKDQFYYQGNIKLILENICVVHPDIIYEWYQQKIIENDIYTQKIIPKLRQLYFYDRNSEQIDAVAIHLRTGDLSKWTWDIGLNLEYYTNIINILNSNLNVKINIYYEGTGKKTTIHLTRVFEKERRGFNYDWVKELGKLENVNLYEGDLDNCEQQFNELTRSKYLILSPSGFSLFSGFINKNKVFVDRLFIKERPNIFKNIDILPEFITYDNFKDTIKYF